MNKEELFMKYPAILGMVTALTLSANAVTFESQIGGREYDHARAVSVVDDGYLIAGYSDSFTHDRDEDGYLIKIDKNGQKQWSLHFGTREDEKLYGMTVDDHHNILVTGYSERLGNNRQSIYLAKISSEGKFLWHRGYWQHSNSLYTGKDVVQSYGGGYIIAAIQDRPKFFKKAVDIFVVGTNPEGKRIGARYYGGSKEDRAEAIIKNDGGYLIAGSTESWGHGDRDMYLIKTDKEGKHLWHQVYGGKYDDVANDVIATEDGYVLVGTTHNFDLTDDDVYVVKVDKQGKLLWQHIYGGGRDDEGHALIEDDDGYVIVGGTASTDKPGYEKDVYLFKISKKSGKLLWQRTFGGEDEDIGYDIAKTDDGYIIVGDTQTPRYRYYDVLVIKTDKNGRIGKK
jgi:hypothetical protein